PGDTLYRDLAQLSLNCRIAHNHVECTDDSNRGSDSEAIQSGSRRQAGESGSAIVAPRLGVRGYPKRVAYGNLAVGLEFSFHGIDAQPGAARIGGLLS